MKEKLPLALNSSNDSRAERKQRRRVRLLLLKSSTSCLRAPITISARQTSARLRPLISVRGLKLFQKKLYLRALDLYASYPFLDFEDALSAAYMEKQGLTEILSYDTDFDRVSGIIRREP